VQSSPQDLPCPQGQTLADVGVERQHIIDAERAFHFDCCSSWSQGKRDAEVRKLAWLLTRAMKDSSDCFYYQGLHDVATVVMLGMGGDRTIPAFQTIVRTYLRGFAAKSMDCACKVLDVFWRALQLLDPELHKFATGCGVEQPIFALSWVITWLSHDLRSFESVLRIFDLLLASPHPLMIVYVCTALVHLHREVLLKAAVDDPAVFFTVLQKLPQRLRGEPQRAASGSPVGGGERLQEVIARSQMGSVSVEQVLGLAVGMFRLCPPHVLLATAPDGTLPTLQRDWPQLLQPVLAQRSQAGISPLFALQDEGLAAVLPQPAAVYTQLGRQAGAEAAVEQPSGAPAPPRPAFWALRARAALRRSVAGALARSRGPLFTWTAYGVVAALVVLVAVVAARRHARHSGMPASPDRELARLLPDSPSLSAGAASSGSPPAGASPAMLPLPAAGVLQLARRAWEGWWGFAPQFIAGFLQAPPGAILGLL